MARQARFSQSMLASSHGRGPDDLDKRGDTEKNRCKVKSSGSRVCCLYISLQAKFLKRRHGQRSYWSERSRLRKFAPKGHNILAQGKVKASCASLAATLGTHPQPQKALKGRHKRWNHGYVASCFALSGLVFYCFPNPGRRCALPRANMLRPLRGKRCV